MRKISSELIERAEKDYVSVVKKSSEAIESTCRVYSTNVGLYAIDLEENSKKIKDIFIQIVGGLSDYLDKTNYMKTSLEQITDSLKSQVAVFDENLEKRLGQFKAELQSINELIESFIELLKKRISAI